MEIRPFQATDSEYEAIIAIHKKLEPERQLTINFLRAQDNEYAANHEFTRVLGEADSQVVAHGAYWHVPDSGNEPPQFSLFVQPDYQNSDIPRQMQNYLLAQIEAMQPAAVVSEPKENELYRIQLLEEENFKLAMRFPRSQLSVKNFDFTEYTPLITRLEKEGIQFINLTQVIERDANWQQHIWQLFNIINQDVPYPDPQEGTPFAEYAQYYQGEQFRPDSWIIAIDSTQEGFPQYVGMSVVNAMQTRPNALFGGITGVIPPYRRRKIATALKAFAAKYAQDNGFLYIETDNEENNPMYTLNLQLGFENLPAWVYYKKQMR